LFSNFLFSNLLFSNVSNPTMTTSTITARRKGDPQNTLLDEKITTYINLHLYFRPCIRVQCCAKSLPRSSSRGTVNDRTRELFLPTWPAPTLAGLRPPARRVSPNIKLESLKFENLKV
jgi:hypothetical protein